MDCSLNLGYAGPSSVLTTKYEEKRWQNVTVVNSKGSTESAGWKRYNTVVDRLGASGVTTKVVAVRTSAHDSSDTCHFRECECVKLLVAVFRSIRF